MQRKKDLNALVLVLFSLSIFALAYRYYGLFIARKVYRD